MDEGLLCLRAELWESLAALGFEEAEGDELTEFALRLAAERVKNRINRNELPKELSDLTVSVGIGEYLRMKKCRGELAGFDLENAVKTIEEGDTRLTFAVGEGSKTAEQRLEELIDTLTDGRMDELYRYRRLVW